MVYRYDPKTDTTRLMTPEEKEQAQADSQASREAHERWLRNKPAVERKRRELYSLSHEEIKAKRKNTPLG